MLLRRFAVQLFRNRRCYKSTHQVCKIDNFALPLLQPHCLSTVASSSAALKREPDSARPKKSTSVAGTFPFWVKTPIDLSIYRAETPKDLIAICTQYKLDPSQIVSLLANLAKIGGKNFLSEHKNENVVSAFLDTVTKSLSQPNEKLSVGEALLALRSLLHLGAEGLGNSAIIKELRECFANALVDKKMNSDTLVSFFAFHNQYQHTDEVAERLQNVLELKLKALLQVGAIGQTNPEWVLQLMSAVPYKSGAVVLTEWQKLMEQNAFYAVVSMDFGQCCRLLGMLAEYKSRNRSLLESICQRIVSCYNQEEKAMTLKQALLILNTTNKLNHVHFLSPGEHAKTTYPALSDCLRDVLVNYLQEGNNRIQIQTLGAIFTTVGQIHWRETEVLRLLCEHIEARLEELKLSDLVPCILALARTNYQPESELIGKIRDRLDRDKFFDEFSADSPTEPDGVPRKAEDIWLDVVWSMGVMEQITQKLASSVLSESSGDVVKKLIDPSNPKSKLNKYKLKNVETALRLDLGAKEFEVSNRLSVSDETADDFFQHETKLFKGSSMSLQELVCSMVHHIAPVKSHSKLMQVCPMGYCVEAEIVYEPSTKKPVAVANWDWSNPEQKRVAVVCTEYTDFTRPVQSEILTGDIAMKMRHLRKTGYTVVQIDYDHFKGTRKFVEKLNILKETLEKILK